MLKVQHHQIPSTTFSTKSQAANTSSGRSKMSYDHRGSDSVVLTTFKSTTKKKQAGGRRKEKWRLISMFLLCFCLFLVELVVGQMTRSTALIADSFHVLTDLAALSISYLSARMTPLKWSRNTFGWARAEVLAALVNAVFLTAICFSLLIEAIKRFVEVQEILEPELIVIVGSLGLVVNVLGLLILRKHRPSLHRPEPEVSAESELNMKGVFLHVMADALGSCVVVCSALVVWLTDWSWRHYLDPALTLVMTSAVLCSVWPLVRDSSLVLLQTVPLHIEVEGLRSRLLADVDGVLGVHELHIWRLTGDRIIASAHILCRSLPEYMALAGRVKEFFHNEGIHSTTIQPEFVDDPAALDCALDCPDPPICALNTCCPPTAITDGS